MTAYTITDEQYEFLAQYHEAIEIYYATGTFYGFAGKIIDELEALPGYKELFADMGWDDIYDRYEDHPKYDRSFRMKLRKQLLSLRNTEDLK